MSIEFGVGRFYRCSFGIVYECTDVLSHEGRFLVSKNNTGAVAINRQLVYFELGGAKKNKHLYGITEDWRMVEEITP